MRVKVAIPVHVSTYGFVDLGEQELPDWLAQLLIERGFAEPLGEPHDQGETRPKKEVKKNGS